MKILFLVLDFIVKILDQTSIVEKISIDQMARNTWSRVKILFSSDTNAIISRNRRKRSVAKIIPGCHFLFPILYQSNICKNSPSLEVKNFF